MLKRRLLNMPDGKDGNISMDKILDLPELLLIDELENPFANIFRVVYEYPEGEQNIQYVEAFTRQAAITQLERALSYYDIKAKKVSSVKQGDFQFCDQGHRMRIVSSTVTEWSLVNDDDYDEFGDLQNEWDDIKAYWCPHCGIQGIWLANEK